MEHTIKLPEFSSMIWYEYIYNCSTITKAMDALPYDIEVTDIKIGNDNEIRYTLTLPQPVPYINITMKINYDVDKSQQAYDNAMKIIRG